MDRGNTRQEILEASLELFSFQGFEATSVSQIAEQYAARSLCAHPRWDSLPGTPDEAVRMIAGQLRYILHDPTVSRARKLLVIEQFRNAELAQMQTRQNYADVLAYFTELVKRLGARGVLQEDDPELMAAQLCLPITVWINLCDREPERETEIMELVERHIRQFFRLYAPEQA